MVGGGREAADEGDSPACVLGGGEDDFLEEIERHVAAAGKGHHLRAGFEELHGEEIDVLIAAGGAIDVAARFGEGGRIADEQIEARRRFADVVEGVGDGEGGFEAVKRVIRAGHLDRRR